jgi:hypothetical protein
VLTAGTAPQQAMYKTAVAGGLNGGMLSHLLQPQRQATHSPDENRAPIFASNVSLTGPGASPAIAAMQAPMSNGSSNCHLCGRC